MRNYSMKKLLIVFLVLGLFACSNNGTDFTSSEALGSPDPVNGVCGLTENTCTGGALVDAADSTEQLLWSCQGKNGGRNVSCKLDKPKPPLNAACGGENNSCLSGTLVDITDSTKDYLWTCMGANDGTNATCSLSKPPPPPEPIDPNCVQVFYDTSVDQFKLGRTYSLMIANLLGHFPEYQQVIGPIEKYRKGDIDRCHATFYVGKEYGNKLPADFISDFNSATKQVVWMGYNFWQLGTQFEKDFGYSATNYSYTTLDYTNRTAAPESKPGFFRDILYKGEVFPKYNEWSDSTKTVLDAPFEIAKLTKISDVATVLGEAKHSVTAEIVPWALKSKNKFFITEVPVSFAHEADRYFVFADLLFDFLNTAPKHNEKNALIRLEDVGPFYQLSRIDEAMAILKKYNVPASFNVYPIFADPLFSISGHNGKPQIRLEEDTPFLNAMKKYKSEGATINWHGVTHQYNNLKNPWTGASGDDYEFWNYPTNSPVAEDSVTYVLDKMDDGFDSFKLVNGNPTTWITPHYHGSALDTVIFGQIFPWVIGRVVYFDSKITGLKAPDPTKPIYFDASNSATKQNRRNFFSDLKVTADTNLPWFGQMFPYELYGDIYGAHVLPENLGNVEPHLSEQTEFIRTADTMLADAKRNLVLRDVWASFFYHPFLLDPKENDANKDITKPKDLERLVSGIQALGYKFVSVEQYADSHKAPVGKPKIDLEEIR